MTSALFGSAPTVVQSGPQSTTSGTQQNVLQTVSQLLQSGGSAPGTTMYSPTSASANYAAPLTTDQNSLISALAGLIQPTVGTGSSVQGVANSIPQTLLSQLGYQAPQVSTPQATYQPTNPQVSQQASNQAFQEGVVAPTTANFLQNVVPQITGNSARSAGGAYSTGQSTALNQAATNLNTTLAGEGAQYALGTQNANQQASENTNSLLTALAQSNLSADTATNSLNTGSSLQGESDELTALGLAPQSINTALTPESDTASILNQLLSGLAQPQTTAQTGIAGQTSAYNASTSQSQALLALMASLGVSPTEQNTSVAQAGSTGLIPSLLSSVAGNTGVGSALAGLLQPQTTAQTSSDERVKTDIEQIGKLTGTKLPYYSYRYKGDHPAVRRIGVMAQDVEKKYPSAVGSSHGVKTVNYAELALREAFPEAA